MKERTNYNWRTFTFLFVAVWMARTAMAQDYPKYAPAGSTFVPLDSWVYGALDRLAAMGWVTTSIQGMKPWTRTECARLTQEAGEALRDAAAQGQGRSPSEEAVRLQKALEREFSSDLEVLNGGRNRSFRLESIYARALSISGPALTDGFHFGQTIGYDFGRPFERGFNSVDGGAVRATYGPFAFYVRAEYQHAPGAPGLSDAVRNFISTLDEIPKPLGLPIAAINRVRLLDTYVSFNMHNWQVSIGKQSLSWGAGEGGAMLLSDNAEPLFMGRVTRVVPARLPGFMSGAGPFRIEMFIAQLRGGTVIPNPLIWGHKFSFKVVPHLEIGYGRTNILGAGDTHLGSPFTFGNFFHAFFNLRAPASAVRKPTSDRPGMSQNSLDVLLDVPGTKRHLTIYGDLYAKDKPLMLMAPTRGAYRVGLYVATIPKAPKFDFRVEATSTDSFRPIEDPNHTQTLNYWSTVYRDGYTNYGVLMGNTVGRQGMTYQAWSSYHFSPTNYLQFQFKYSWLDPLFIPGGGNWEDYTARHEIHLHSGIYLRSFIQFENIRNSSVLYTLPMKNVTASVEIGFVPKWAQ